MYGFYAKEILLGHSVPFDSEHIPAYLLVFIAKLFSLSLDTTLFYAPVFVSSLSVIPVIMIGYAYNLVRFSFFVALIGSVGYAYYIRSFLGYYDTDVLNVFFSLLIVAFMILTVEKKRKIYLLGVVVSLGFFYLWYHSSKLIILILILNFVLYLSVWKYKIFLQRKKLFLFLLILVTAFALFYQVEIGSLFIRGYAYIFKAKNIYLTQQNNHTLIFYATLQTVGEAKALPWGKLGMYLSVNNFYFYLSLVALLLFSIRFRSFFLSFSLLFLALFSLKSGIRFSEYGVYIMAFGAVYILCIVRNILLYFGVKYRYAQAAFMILFIVLLGVYLQKILYKNRYLHPVFNAKSVKLLRKLDTQLEQKDYILTWWDYGWPLWYYTKANTLIDNGKHFEDNYIISKLLFANQHYTAKAAKYLLQNCNTKRCYLSRMIFKKKSPAEIDHLINNSKLQKTDKTLYFLFHKRMVRIMRVIANFSNRDPQSAKINKKQGLHVVKIGAMYNGTVISKNAKVKLNLKKRELFIKEKNILLQEIYIVNNNKRVIKLRTKYKRARLYAILFNKRYIILCNRYVFNSFFIQAMVLNNYDRKIFKLFGQSDEIKILQLK